MRKVDDGRKKKRKKKIMLLLVATNVVASRPPECRPTGTPHARANSADYAYEVHKRYFSKIFFLTFLGTTMAFGPKSCLSFIVSL